VSTLEDDGSDVIEVLAIGGRSEEEDEVRFRWEAIADLAEGSAEGLIPTRRIDHGGGGRRWCGTASVRHFAPPLADAAAPDMTIVRSARTVAATVGPVMARR
jgi:hypothetical protein